MPYLVSYPVEQPLKEIHQNQWCIILCRTKTKEKKKLPYLLSIHHDDSQEWEETQYLQHYVFLPSSWRIGILYIPPKSDKISITSIQNIILDTSKISIKIIPISRLLAAGLLTTLHPAPLFKTLLGSPKHLKKRLRTALNQSYTKSETNLSYQDWCQLYDCWEEKEKKALYQSKFYEQWPVIHSLCYTPPDNHYPETDSALDQQWPTPKSAKHAYIAILQNGEILPAHAFAIFADQAARHQYPAALYADSDMLNQHHQRATPHFKPNISYMTLLSGLLTQDIWLFRKDIFDAYQQEHPKSYQSAYAHRLALALFIWKQQYPIHHIPYILSHRQIAPGKQALQDMQEIVQNDLSARQWTGNVQSNHFPLKINLHSNNAPVSLVIPTTISSKTIQKSIRSILTQTDYPHFEVILVISQPSSLTHRQRCYLRPLLSYKNLRVIWLKTETFNFSQSCNFGIHHTHHEFVAIVNDDITPKNPQWLINIMGHMQDPKVGAVGAKLYYPNGQIQHAGIIMGAANLCEHAGRFQRSNRIGLTYDHDVSAVTGACMLIRRSAYTLIQGFDENYEISYNDIDFCLRLRKANYHVIQCQQAELIHYESLSLGNHYTGKRAGKERQEILSIRAQWQSIDHQDPFYNPNLSLQRGMDGKLAFPPRVTRPFATSTCLNKEFL
ncbi:hypothetical protein CIN_04730 [Commensalibacter intestini A911]|uniref:Glycosyltransferase 2-like domain-containing protein n=1 Tax=Commensalibacter intestini A911 TaxID=1088868 RepID=G6EYF3_9PROT|nr:glycosyltransferase [Commensalibacter intestini]EHD14541.1 hypothetical protein CIN_04730 [Commensalibacter intestini A911]